MKLGLYVILANTFDIISTFLSIKSGNIEVNILYSFFSLQMFLFFKFFYVVCIVYLVYAFASEDDKRLFFNGLFYLFIFLTWWNLYQIVF